MKFLQKKEFLSIFAEEPSIAISSIKVSTNQKIVPLRQYIRDKEIPMEDIRAVLKMISHKNEYLERFYDTSLEIPDTLSMTFQKPMTANKMNNNSQVQYKNIIRNMFYREILQKTKSVFPGNKSYMDVVLDFYTRGIIDYKILTPSAIHYIKEGRLGSVFSSYFFRASIMNPFLVYSLNESVLHGKRIFTPTLGWCSYCYGFLESPIVEEYVGTDVIPVVCRKTATFANAMYPTKKTSIYCSPSEKLLENKEFMKKYKNHFDVVFFSPPYFRLELYPGNEQSTTQYKTYDEWLKQYWEKTIQLCHWVLSPKGKCCYILSGYGSKPGESYDLLKDMNRITSNYFLFQTMKPMYNKNVHVTAANHRETAEKIMIFMKSTKG
jgi:hypothetical protein